MIDTNDFDSMQTETIRFEQEMHQRAENNVPPGQKNNKTPFCRRGCPLKSLFNTGNSGDESDMILLMALMLVLTSDGGDKMLLMALLYIMT